MSETSFSRASSMRSGGNRVDMINPPISASRLGFVSVRPSAITVDRISRLPQSLSPQIPFQALRSYTQPVPPILRSTLTRVSPPTPASVPLRWLLGVPGRAADRDANSFPARSVLTIRVAAESARQRSKARSEEFRQKVQPP